MMQVIYLEWECPNIALEMCPYFAVEPNNYQPNDRTMKHLLHALMAFLLILSGVPEASAQCTTTNATSCECPGGGSECDLLPDMTISWYALLNYLSGPNEANGRINITGSTPNIGHGPLEVRGVDLNGYRRFACGTDTFTVYDPNAQQQFACPNGGTAKQLTTQRVFHKNGSTMTSYERVMPQGMTYHPTHGHTHYDQWGIYSLRMQESGVSDPRDWPIINSGYKLGFCLMDYNTCSDGAVNNHCKDNNTQYNSGTTLHGSDFPNFGLGGGNYGCGMTRQGISSGYTDIYSEYLDGMWIDIPSGTCNGDYWIVYEVDPLDVVIEEDNSNNWTAVPITLTQQSNASSVANIHCDEQAFVCPGAQVRLKASAGTSYLWSNGATTSTIMAGPGTYTVQVTSYCGTATSAPFTVAGLAQAAAPTAEGAIVCEGESAELTTTAANAVWYDGSMNQVATGPLFTTPALYASTSYSVVDVDVSPGQVSFGGKTNNNGGGTYHAGGQNLKFNANRSFRLNSVKLYAGSAGYRTIELVDAIGVLRASRSANVPAGESRMDLDFDILPGNNYLLTVSGGADLWRDFGSVAYPYDVAGVATITSSSSGSDYYYYFYDWEVEEGAGTCVSPATDVSVVVELCTGVDEPLALRGFEVYPNPNNGQFAVSIHLLTSSNVLLDLTDMMGRSVLQERFMAPAGQVLHAMELEGAAAGIYNLILRVDGRVFQRRVVVK
ncbi:MAG: T9SS type A sorting domain-containing protein [Flavobacteriales bacterium]|nr:T9SS type A sorting domain-containing protein [Flavobacteriales bacterium]